MRDTGYFYAPYLDLPQSAPEGFKGIEEILKVEYVNEDGKLSKYNCGQAAVATLIQFYQRDREGVMEWLEKEHPPNVLFGYLGTTRRRVERGLRAAGLRPYTIHGVDALKKSLDDGKPGIFTYQFELMKVLGVSIPTAHWMVAFGYNDEYVFVTNWWKHRIPWDEFLVGWSGWIPAITSMKNAAILVN
jgi:hypothetical protein